MKVVLLTRSLDYGGAPRQLVTLAQGLAARGHAVVVGVFYGGGPLEAELAAAGVRVHSLNKRHRWDVVRFLSAAYRFWRTERPDVMLSYLIAPDLLAVLLRPFFPETRIVWSIRASRMDLRRYDRLARATFKLGCLLSSATDRILVNSQAGLRYHQQCGYPQSKMTWIPNGIDTRRFHPDRRSGKPLRAAWNVQDDMLLIGLAGRLDPMKDHETFLAAAALLAASRDDVRFVCVGDGPEAYRRFLRERSEALGVAERVIWVSATGDMPAVFNALDLVTSSSAFGEGFSNSIGEAMACGIPCVVTDAGDSALIVGDTGAVVPPADPGRLALAWSSCLDGRRPGDAEHTRARIVNTFSVETLVDRTEDVLKTVITGA
jgi:glycosyltransferase involved in cell wall biosynthesis